ncbi:MAG TPA: glycosyltransferase family 4 protein, partial [Mariprofundaceae bacterium]|nr:glycosyltransferase family 4 protein [Mariprofundaceae bacterium]
RRICFVVASEMTVKAFLKEPIAAIDSQDDVSLIVDTRDPDALREAGIRARVLPLSIARDIALFRDFRVLLQLWRIFRREQFDIVHSLTPKAGLLAMLAGRLAGIPVRIHIFTGQVWATRQGFSRWLLKLMDRILAASATHLLADSPSQRQFLIDQGVASADRIAVLGKGSISGVDVQRFAPDPQARTDVRGSLGIADSDVVFLFLGRLNRDKGVLDLAQAFANIAGDQPHAQLLIVGPDEGGMASSMRTICRDFPDRIHFVSYTDNPQRYMAAADVFCLPSYREGFGSVIIEAAATGIPAIGSEIYGITDAIERDCTGLLFPVGDIEELAKAMIHMLADPARRQAMGAEAMQRARRDFDAHRVADTWLAYYSALP